MTKKKLYVALVSILLAILLSVCVYLHSIERGAISDYDKESTITINDTSGNILVKEKKYSYDSSDIMVLSVENNTENAYTILIKSNFTQNDGTKKQMVQWFTGFPAGYHNYFVFKPEIQFIDYEFEITTQPYTKETPISNIVFGTDINIDSRPLVVDFYGNHLSPDQYLTSLDLSIPIKVSEISNYGYKYNIEIVMFNNKGEIYLTKDISNIPFSFHNDHSREFTTSIPLLDTPWKDYKLPLELKGDIKAIVAIKSIETVN